MKFEYKRDIASVYETTGLLSNTEANFLSDVFVSFSVEVRMMLTWQTCLTLWDLPSSYPLPLRECSRTLALLEKSLQEYRFAF